jgi:hypothetical protein
MNWGSNMYKNSVMARAVCLEMRLIAKSLRDAAGIANKTDNAPIVRYEMVTCPTCQARISNRPASMRASLTTVHYSMIKYNPTSNRLSSFLR